MLSGTLDGGATIILDNAKPDPQTIALLERHFPHLLKWSPDRTEYE
jgi:hypothetical protein